MVSACIQDGHDAALEEVERIISAGGYDHDKSIAALNDQGLVSPDYDTCYVLAAYSASMEQRGASRSDLKAKLQASRGRMYQVTYEEKETTVTVTGENGQSESKTVRYAACTIHPFDQSVILTAFGVDTSAQYGQFGVTYGDAISHMSQALKMTLYGAMGGGTVAYPLWEAARTASSAARAFPLSMSSPASLTPPARFSALPPMQRAAPAFIKTTSRLCPRSVPLRMARVVAAFSSGVPPVRSDFWQRVRPNCSGVIS